MTAGGATYTIPNYQDATGLKELWAEWYGTIMSDIDDSGNTSATDGTYGEQNDTTTGSYLNWGSEGKINCLVLDNNNLWVYGNGNTWINGQAFSMIKGGSDVLIEKYSSTTVLGEKALVQFICHPIFGPSDELKAVQWLGFWVWTSCSRAATLTGRSSSCACDGICVSSSATATWWMAERGLSLAHTTIMRWVHDYAPEFERRWNRFARPAGSSWRVDETYVRIRGK
jgi:hypothetical protein